MLNFFGGVLLVAVVVVVIYAVTDALNVSRATRLSIAGAAGLWLGLQIALAAQGAFTSEFSRAFPLVGVMVALPPLAAVALAVFSPAARRIMLSLPPPLLIGLNAGRLLGVFFLLLAASGRLGGPFPFYAGWGDVIVGAVAVPLSIAAASDSAGRGPILAWNIFGTLDLVLAVTLGTLSSNGFAYQVIEAGPGSQAVQVMPFLLIPTVLVPFYLVMHGIVFAQLRQRSVATAAQRP